jgi:outer membrane immunogenic protein
MKRLRSILALAVAGTISAVTPAAAQGGYGLPPPEYYPALWQGVYGGFHLGYGDADRADGFVGGVQIGHNWQSGQLVYGLEADVTWSDISDSERISVCGPGVPSSCVSARVESSIDWMGTVRARAGYLFQPGLLGYVTAGFGFVSGSGSASLRAGDVHFEPFTDDETDVDFVYGIGVEGKFTPTSTLRIEYLGFSDTDLDIIRASVNFRLY